MKILSLVLFLLLLTAPIVAAQQSEQSKTYAETRQLLLTMDRSDHDDGALKKLFEESAARQSDLIQALYDPDKKVGVNAQVLIRYAGDPVGLAAIEEWIASRQKQTEDYWMPNIESVGEVVQREIINEDFATLRCGTFSSFAWLGADI